MLTIEEVNRILDESHKKALDLIDNDDWEDNGIEEDIFLSRRQTESGIYMVKSFVKINHPPEVIRDFVWDIKKRKEWDKNLDEIYEVQKFNDNCRIIYQRLFTPWPVSQRDFVFAQRHQTVGDTTWVIGESVDAGVRHLENVVRGRVMSSGYRIKKIGEKQSAVTFMSAADPMGSIPLMVVNTVSKRQSMVVGVIKKILG